jgi:hypothetical protein
VSTRYTRRVLRCLAVLCLLAACPGAPKSSVGRTRDTAIALVVQAADAPGALFAETAKDMPVRELPHWYSFDLPASRSGDLDVSLHFNGSSDSLALELYDAGGASLGTAPAPTASPGATWFQRKLHLESARGRVFVKVTGGAPATTYTLLFASATTGAMAAKPADCDPHSIDPDNPRCAGVVPCDANKPDFTNKSCCATRCERCGAKVNGIAGTEYGWLALGAKDGLNTRFRGKVHLFSGGKPKDVALLIYEVERERSKIWIGKNIDQASSDEVGFAEVHAPLECGGPPVAPPYP